MLIRPGADAEPAVISDVHQPARPWFTARHRGVLENRLVADQRQHFRCARHIHGAAAVAGLEAADLLGEVSQADFFEHALQRQIFAERYQMDFIVDALDRAVGVDDVDGIVRARICGGGALRGAHRAGDQFGTGLQQTGDLRQRIRLARQKKRKRRFRPDQMRNAV